MLRAILLLLVFQASSCLGSYYDFGEEEVTLPRKLSAEDVKAIDNNVKVLFTDAITAKWDKIEKQYNISENRYMEQCEKHMDNLGKDCVTCAEKACEPSDLEKLKYLLKKGVKAVKKVIKKIIDAPRKLIKKAHKVVKKVVKKIFKGAKKLIKGIGKGKLFIDHLQRSVRKVVRKVGRVLRRVGRKVRRVIRRVARGVRRVIRRVGRAIRRVFRVRVRSVDGENEALLSEWNHVPWNVHLARDLRMQEYQKITKKVTRAIYGKKERTWVVMKLDGSYRTVGFPKTYIDNIVKLQNGCVRALKRSLGDLFPNA
ncbi:hypothetical protein KUTeg_012246 [Tegillarca granosa]|uniref:Uncharacterized protein n=1 Tax=Tegillarca granosa TaxID=220873 RepID=A0ABQ9F1E7_TEGGR|nr:hypothetical protein KUTeg_012246 [Tegillarca granosa]